MKNECFDIGVIQTFVDGELDLQDTEQVVRHLTVCEVCTELVNELESENEFAFSAMEPEFNVLVPTERLRAKVFASIRDIDSKERKGIYGNWAGIFVSLGVLLRPGFAAPAVLVILAAFVLFTFEFNGLQESGSAVKTETIARVESGRAVLPETTEIGEVADSTPMVSDDESTVQESIVRIGGAPAERKEALVSNAVHITVPADRTASKSVAVVPAGSSLTPAPSSTIEAEDGYLRTIATLNRTVEQNKDFVLRPNERVAFERDLAVVNDAIKKLKGEVRDNPSNTAAREILRSSYKNKIELLSSVADRSEMVASLD